MYVELQTEGAFNGVQDSIRQIWIDLFHYFDLVLILFDLDLIKKSNPKDKINLISLIGNKILIFTFFFV